MKIALPILVLFLCILTSCNESRYITERYIKNNIEEHTEGSESSIRTYLLYRGATFNGDRYLELTGYKYKGKKGLVIGTDVLVSSKRRSKPEVTVVVLSDFTELSLAQAQTILDQYKVLLKKLQSEKVRKGESVYQDFTISKDVFISFRKMKGNSEKDKINFWVKGEKYTVSQAGY